MNGINGSLAHWYAERMLKRTVQPIKIGIIANKQFPYEHTTEGTEVQSWLIPKPMKEPKQFKFYFGIVVGAAVSITFCLTVFKVLGVI